VHVAPPGVDLGVVAKCHGPKDPPGAAILVFAADAAALDAQLDTIHSACKEERVTWVAYPKGGQLGTDLNRDRLAERLGVRGLTPVRQIAIDDVWSALRFRQT
jgi:hypothetical protein